MLSSLQTVRVWQGSENGNYDCRHILKDHTAEVIDLIYANENISSLLLLVILIVPLITLVKHDTVGQVDELLYDAFNVTWLFKYLIILSLSMNIGFLVTF